MALARKQSSPGARHEAAPIIGLATLMRKMFAGEDIEPIRRDLLKRIARNPDDGGALFDLSTIELLCGNREIGLSLQTLALQRQRLYRPIAAAHGSARLLALSAPGDFMANTPVEFLLENSDIALDLLFLSENESFPGQLPEHDVAFVAVAESDANRKLLAGIARASRSLSRPLINAAENIERLTRDGAHALLRDTPGVTYPCNLRVARATLDEVAQSPEALEKLLPGLSYPIIIRPLNSHAGAELNKIEAATELVDYLEGRAASVFYVAPFVNYASKDRLFRKMRIVLIEGEAYPVHMAVSKNWMVHYLNADMFDSATHRAEEARFMRDFDADFAYRHARALEGVYERARLDYLLIDCAQTQDGRLLIFEVGTAMIVHNLDPVGVFPYKAERMEKIFKAFARMLQRRARR